MSANISTFFKKSHWHIASYHGVSIESFPLTGGSHADDTQITKRVKSALPITHSKDDKNDESDDGAYDDEEVSALSDDVNDAAMTSSHVNTLVLLRRYDPSDRRAPEGRVSTNTC